MMRQVVTARVVGAVFCKYRNVCGGWIRKAIPHVTANACTNVDDPTTRKTAFQSIAYALIFMTFFTLSFNPLGKAKGCPP